MKTITEILTADVRSIVIGGHVNPDGDCVGSCMSLFLYLKKNYPELNVQVYLEEPRRELRFLTEAYEGTSVFWELPVNWPVPDLFVLLDVGTRKRIGVVGDLVDVARKTVCIDHHEANDGIADVNHVEPNIGSCAEVLYGLLDDEKIDPACAEAIYTGIIHDTGVFQYTNTRPETMMIAGNLMKKGVDTANIIYGSFNARSYVQSTIMGYCLSKSRLTEDGRIIYAQLSLEEMKEYGAAKSDLGEIVSQLRLTKGIIAAVFAYEMHAGAYKLSFRSTEDLDVNRVAGTFGGGGHARAAGATVNIPANDLYRQVINAIYDELEE
ncbi:MAG: DHH family phosphoesterase [Lachnospiraceae bacterium]|nr:DHH family phosphoesterase [Candidatus Equihabitans merdae]